MTRWLIVALLAFTLGFHWTILQSAAWVGMMVRYTQEASFTQAVEKTFDGQHPCKLCHFVKEGKQAEKKTESELSLKKFDPFAGHDRVTFYFASPRLLAEEQVVAFQVLAHSPPLPPPRSA